MTYPPFIDIHTHVLYGVDDGAKDRDQSQKMLEQALQQGITQLVITPHITDLSARPIIERILDHFQQLQQMVSGQKLPLQLFSGAELFYNERIFDWLIEPWATINNNGKYFLFELPLFDFPKGVSEFIFQAKLKGITPILAHPERYIYLHKNMEKLISWHQQGCLMQMNAGSLTGHFGDEVAEFSRHLLEFRFYDLVASDAHNTEVRNFKVLPKAYEIANSILPVETCQLLFSTNPGKAITGEPIHQYTLKEDLIRKNWFQQFFKNIKRIKRNQRIF